MLITTTEDNHVITDAFPELMLAPTATPYDRVEAIAGEVRSLADRIGVNDRSVRLHVRLGLHEDDTRAHLKEMLHAMGIGAIIAGSWMPGRWRLWLRRRPENDGLHFVCDTPSRLHEYRHALGLRGAHASLEAILRAHRSGAMVLPSYQARILREKLRALDRQADAASAALDSAWWRVDIANAIRADKDVINERALRVWARMGGRA